MVQPPPDPLAIGFGFQVGLAVAVAFSEWAAAIVPKVARRTEEKDVLWATLVELMPIEEVTGDVPDLSG